MTIDEVASELAMALMADPGHHFVRIWRIEDSWGWDRGHGDLPPDADVVWADRVENGDADLLTDLGDYDRYASELNDWVHQLA
jgi:hypothetical protein